MAVQAGGDWYDAFELPDGRVGLLIGDVAGHGVAAAALMGQVRALARAQARSGADPADVLTELISAISELTAALPQTLITCCYLTVDLDSGILRVASAGHLPPLRRLPHGHAEQDGRRTGYLDVRPGLPLGVLPDARYTTSTHTFPAGALVLLFTDGLVERPGQDLDDGLARLREELAHAPDAVEQLSDHLLVTILAEHPATDDVALVVAQATQRGVPAEVGRAVRG